MSSNEKIDVIDFIINILREHEKNLDTQISRLEGSLDSALKGKPSDEVTQTKNAIIKAIYNNWNEFQEKSMKPDIASFNMRGKKVVFSALKNNLLNIYLEEISEVSMTIERTDERLLIKGVEVDKAEDHPLIFNGRLQCGLNLKPKKFEQKLPDGGLIQKIMYEIDTDETRGWLSKMLNIDREKIVYGEIEA